MHWDDDDDDDMMCIRYGRPVAVRCKGVRLGMGWVGLGQLFGGLGWAGSMKIDPRTTLCGLRPSVLGQDWSRTKNSVLQVWCCV